MRRDVLTERRPVPTAAAEHEPVVKHVRIPAPARVIIQANRQAKPVPRQRFAVLPVIIIVRIPIRTLTVVRVATARRTRGAATQGRQAKYVPAEERPEPVMRHRLVRR